MPTEVVVLAAVLCITFVLGCLALVAAAVFLIWQFSKQLSLTTELAIRMPYRADPNDYGTLAVADAMAAGRKPSEAESPSFGGGGGDMPQMPDLGTVPMSDGAMPPRPYLET